jgi:hypothetical protein
MMLAFRDGNGMVWGVFLCQKTVGEGKMRLPINVPVKKSFSCETRDSRFPKLRRLSRTRFDLLCTYCC